MGRGHYFLTFWWADAAASLCSSKKQKNLFSFLFYRVRVAGRIVDEILQISPVVFYKFNGEFLELLQNRMSAK